MATINKAECNFFSRELRLGGGRRSRLEQAREYGFKADHELVKGNKRVPLGTATAA